MTNARAEARRVRWSTAPPTPGEAGMLAGQTRRSRCALARRGRSARRARRPRSRLWEPRRSVDARSATAPAAPAARRQARGAPPRPRTRSRRRSGSRRRSRSRQHDETPSSAPRQREAKPRARSRSRAELSRRWRWRDAYRGGHLTPVRQECDRDSVRRGSIRREVRGPTAFRPRPRSDRLLQTPARGNRRKQAFLRARQPFR